MDKNLVRDLFDFTAKGDLAAVKKLVEQHPDIDLNKCWKSSVWTRGYPGSRDSCDDGYSLVHQAAMSDCKGHSVELLKYFIEEHHMDPSIRSNGGRGVVSPLYCAIEYDNIDAVKYFIEELHVDPYTDAPNPKNGVPLHYAVCNWLGGLSTVRYFVEERKMDVLAKDDRGQVPLKWLLRTTTTHWNEPAKRFNVLKYFVEECQVDLSNPDGFTDYIHVTTHNIKDIASTALHLAVRYSIVDVVKYLVEHAKCDPMAKDGDGRTPLELAYEGVKSDKISQEDTPVFSYLENLWENSNSPPLLITHTTRRPMDKIVTADQKFEIEVIAVGKQPMSFQWSKDGEDMMVSPDAHHSVDSKGPGVTISTLQINAATTDHEGNYKCIATNEHGTVESQSGFLTVVKAAPTIITSPCDQTKLLGDRVNFTVTATGKGTLKYQWCRDGEGITYRPMDYYGEKKPSFTIWKVKTRDYAGTYSCIVSNEAGSVESNRAQLVIANSPPQLTKQPTDETAVHGQEVAFKVTTREKDGLSYQWCKDGEDITPDTHRYYQGATTTTLRINAATADHEGEYKCRVINPHGTVESQRARLTVVALPTINSPPCDQTKTYGDTVTFSVTASGKGALSYQWCKDGADITPDTHPYCHGATTPTLKIKAALTQYEGVYSCVVSNEAGSVESDGAQLGIVSPVTSLFNTSRGRVIDKSNPPSDLSPLGPPKVEHIGTTEKVVTGADDGIKVKVPPQSESNGSIQIQSFTPSSSSALVELPPDTKFVSPIYEVTTPGSSKLEGAEASIQHYAHLRSDEDKSDMRFLHSSNPSPPYHFVPMQGGNFTNQSNAGTIPLQTAGRYAVGASTERQEQYTLYFVYPVPKLSGECMYALFSASYRQHAFETHLLEQMENRFEPAKFWQAKSNVTLSEGTDAFELVPQGDPEKLGYSITPLSREAFKIPVKDLVDYTSIKDTRLCLPPSVLMYVEPCDPYPTKDLKCKLQVTGVTDETAFVLQVKAPKGSGAHVSLSGLGVGETAPAKLTSEDITRLIKILTPYSGKWRSIGTELGFKTHELGTIEADPALQSDGLVAFLSTMLQEWGKWPNPTLGVKHTSYASLESLETALKSPEVNLDELAHNLRQDLHNVKQGIQVPNRRQPQKRVAATKSRITTDLEFVPMQDVPDNVVEYSATMRWELDEIHDQGITGEGITIAILDNGINIHHNAFKAGLESKRIATKNFVPGEENISVYQCKPEAHGTMAAFIAGGEGFSNVPNGVAPKATLLYARIGENKSYSVPAVIAALEFLLELRQTKGEDSLHVISMSFGMPYRPKDEDQRIIQTLVLQLKLLNVVCVASAGNYGAHKGGVLFPACSEDVICVGALTVKGHNRESNAPTGIDVLAPGEHIPVPSMHSEDKAVTDCGSSCAAPAIAGLLALVQQYGKKCKSNPNDREKYHTLLYIQNKLFKTKMKGDFETVLKPKRFFKPRLKEFEREQELERLRNAA